MNNYSFHTARVNKNIENNSMKEFNLDEALNGAKVCTRDGRKITIICITRGKVYAKVHGSLTYMDQSIKFNLDGSHYGPTVCDNLDLMMVA